MSADYYKEELIKLTDSLGVERKYWPKFLEAVTHSSFIQDSGVAWKSNERIEFLGDSVIGLIISDYLYRKYPDAQEGMLAVKKAGLVSTESLAETARQLDLGRFLLMSHGETLSKGQERSSVLADLYESIIGTVFLCKGFNFTSNLVKNQIAEKLGNISFIQKDAKTQLQECLQEKFKSAPIYVVEREEGAPHAKTFFINATLNGKIIGTGSGKTKKEAEVEAAKDALNQISQTSSKEETAVRH